MNPIRTSSSLVVAALLALSVVAGCSPSAAPEPKPVTPAAGEEKASESDAKLYEKTQSEAYAMGLEAWEKLAESNNGTKESSDYNKTLSFYLGGGIGALKKLMEASDNMEAFVSASDAAEKVSEAMKAAGVKAYGTEDVQETDHLYRQIELVKVMEVVVSKGKMTEMLVTGNQFREIYDVYGEQTKTEAAKTKADPAKEIDAVTAACDAAKEAGSLLGEGESMMISQLLAHWLAPGTYDSPAPLEAKTE